MAASVPVAATIPQRLSVSGTTPPPSATRPPENEPTSPTAPLAPYPPVLPTDSRSRAPEFYGFVAWASTYLLFVLYLLWAFLPDEHILALGVSWYPNREWALLIPAYGMVLVLLTYFTYFALALARTPAFNDISTITDSKAHLPGPHPHGATATTATIPTTTSSGAAYAPYLAHARPDAIPEMYDIPLGLVNRVVYGPRRQPEPALGRTRQRQRRSDSQTRTGRSSAEEPFAFAFASPQGQASDQGPR
ncbi:PIG-P-domain-containing protein [Trametes coccinea BRFM310]|uniref:PIG-P-domain-containing protein n=1 Tax=Trametes coccinea (strain BRFM310) TaxID=1353009 RepID=A0A1Y2IVV7_TRAC3|nr:PIG-P-domain-containing protein [Trametes coccinea BRFM310]